MHQLITTRQNNELNRMLKDQKISIQNLTSVKTGIQKKFNNFEDWYKYVLTFKRK